MIKNDFLYLLIISFILVNIGFSSPLEIGNNGYGNPFLIYNNPALICRQEGVPVGGSLYYNPSLKKYVFVTGFIESFNASAFSVCYQKNTSDDFNTFSTAFSTAFKKISFGSSFHFLFTEQEPVFTLDAGVSYHFKERRYIDLVVKNCIEADTRKDIFTRQICISHGGNMPGLKRMFYTVRGRGLVYNFNKRDFGYGGTVNIHKFFFANPSLSIYSRGEIVYKHERDIEWLVEAMAGYHHVFNSITFGIYTGYKYFSFSEKNAIACSFYVNPLYRRKITYLTSSISIDSPKMTPNGDNIHDNVIVTIQGIFSKENIFVKRWTLVITESRDPESSIIRTFSGGNMPPSAIVWDGRDMKGEIVKAGTYCIKLILVDSIKRIVSSSYKEVTVY